jgi:manganese-dependent ADP-ribose/CDP-alcohol diphosphatase
VTISDIIDGKCQAIALHGGEPLPPDIDPGHKVVDEVMKALSAYTSRILHAYGNHCLYNLDRASLQTKLGIPFVKEPNGELVGYSNYTYKGVRFITLDSYDVAQMQRCEKSSLKRKQADTILLANNPNFPASPNSPESLVGVQKRFVAFNGAVGSIQLEWLRQQLHDVRSRGERALILSHQPILPGSTNPVCLVWNYKDVLKILRKYSDVVMASFSGHAHEGGYLRDKSGIHFRVFEAALESPHPHKTYAMIDVYDDHLDIRGFGNCKSAVYELDHVVSIR